MELAKEEVRVRQANEGDEVTRIREALENHVKMGVAKKGEGVIDRDSERFYKADMEKYEKLVERFSERAEAQASHSSDAHRSPTGEGDPSARTTGDSEKGDPDDTSKDKDPATDSTYGGYFKGTKVSVARVHPHPTDASKDMLEVVGEDGRVRRIHAADFTTQPPAPGKELVLRNTTSTEVVPYQAKTEAEPNEAEPSAPEKQSRFEALRARIKSWLPNFQRNSGSTVWADRWRSALRGEKAGALEHGVPANATQDEKERGYRRNRVAWIAGPAAVLAVAGGLFLGLSQDTDASDLFRNEPTVSDTPSPEASDPPKEEAPVVPANDGSRWNGAELGGDVELSDPIPLGGGGEELFKGLGMDASRWYSNEDAILEQYPGEFYRMNDGHVGIANPGPLSVEAQNFIKSLQ
jgi:hypothetical protein